MTDIPHRWAIAGPTAVGKTAVGIAVAQKLGSACISVDAVAVYKSLNIGSAKPTADEQKSIPWYGIDLVAPTDDFTVQDFTAHAEGVLGEYASRGLTPLMVGGTGLYIRPMLATLSIPPVGPQPELRASWTDEAAVHGTMVLHERLQKVDPESADRIPPGDLKRIMRALEVHAVTGKPMSSWRTPEGVHGIPKIGARLIVLERDMDELDVRINSRVQQMMTDGFLAEVEGLLAAGIPPDAKAMLSLGYRHLVEYLSGKRGYDATVDAIAQDTRRFARRQRTWFRGDPLTEWMLIDAGETVSESADRIFRMLTDPLSDK
ncbi:MAG: tRNA (adenosine(37)-N6)-dimethylallyltransferase MiaA [Armatimonadota bacterium]